MKRILNWENLFLAALIIFAGAVRFYGLDKLAFFTYDQARDALYIKRILVDHKLRLIGVQSSIPGLYTGPLYYYLMAPFLWVFALNPIGLDLATALFGTLAVAALYCLAKNLSGSRLAAFLAATLFAFQPQIIAQSRFAWNPNPMPLFTLIFIWGLWLIIRSRPRGWWPTFISLAILLQLHYSAVSFIFALLLVLFVFRKKIKPEKNFFLSFLTFGLTMSPLLVFELRHRFSNTKAVLAYLQKGAPAKIAPPSYFPGLLDKFNFLFSGLLLETRQPPQAYFYLAVSAFLVVLAFLKNKKTRNSLELIAIVLGVGVLFSGLYRGSFFDFYLTFLYPLPFLFLAVVAAWLFKANKINRLLAVGLIFATMVIALSNFKPAQKPERTIADILPVAQIIAKDAKNQEKFNLAAVLGGDRFDYNAVDYRYFTEAYYGKKALDWEGSDYKNSRTLYVVIKNNLLASPLESKIMEIRSFAGKRVIKKWQLENGFTIYKLEK